MKTEFVRWLGFVALAAVAGCSSATDVTAPTPEVPRFSCLSIANTMRLPAELRATLPTFGARTRDDDFVAVSLALPGGFAGLFYEDNHFVLTFTDPVVANASRPQIQQEFANRGLAGPGFDAATAEIRGARWTFAELDEWFRYITVRLPDAGSRVTSLDIDEKANTISIGVIDEDSRTRVEDVLASIGVSCNLVTTHIQAPAVPA